MLGLAISITEIVRIIYGVTNRGLSNYNIGENPLYNVKDDSNLYPVQNFPRRVEKFHYWPWSYAANLFGLVAIFAGLTGLISAYRRSYSTVFLFMSLSLLSALFGGYLIGYYAVLISYYNANGLYDQNRRPSTMNTTWGIMWFNLAASIAITLLGGAAFLIGFIGIRGCSPKGLHLEETKVPYVEPAGPKGKIIATNYLG